MQNKKNSSNSLINIEVFIGGAPLLEMRLCEGLLKFGQSHPQWRFSLRGADYRYSKDWLKERNISGVLALINSKPVSAVLDKVKIPWVHLLPGKIVSHPFVRVNDSAIGSMGAEFFLKKGFFKCAFCGVGTHWSNKRAEGFRKRLLDARRSCEFIDIPFENRTEWGFAKGAEKILQRWISKLGSGVAIMAAHDQLANRIVDICLQQGVRVPHDIAIIGVGNHDMLCKLSPVPISSIDTGIPQVAISGCSMLETLIEKKREVTPIVVSPLELIERRSTEIINYGDDLIVKIISHIQDHACDGLTIENIISLFPISRRTLQRRFMKYVGHSPSVEIRKVRIKHAQNMITKTYISLSEIAFTCGYSDLSHMDRAFRDTLNTTPTALRHI